MWSKEARIQHQHFPINSHIHQPGGSLNNRRSGIPIILDQWKVITFHHVSIGMDLRDQRCVRCFCSSIGFGISQPFEGFLNDRSAFIGKFLHLVDIGFNIQPHRSPLQLVLLTPGFELLVARRSLSVVAKIEPVTLFLWQQQPGSHWNVEPIEFFDNIRALGGKIQYSQREAGVKRLQVVENEAVFE